MPIPDDQAKTKILQVKEKQVQGKYFKHVVSRPYQTLGIQIKPRGSKSSPRDANQALVVRIEPLRVKIKP